MQIVPMYKCEYCDSLYKYQDEALACEARHFDLTIDEYKYYLQLQEDLRAACWKRGYCQNEETLKAEDEAAKRLVNFETTYKLNVPHQRRV